MSQLELFQFGFSHYNEKARWALDFKQVPHVRHTLLPGPHAFRMRRITGGTEVPVLQLGDEVVSGSAQIIDWLEREHPISPLYPEDAKERARALEIQTWFDEEVGAHVRCACFRDFLPDGAYAASFMTMDRGPVTRALYQLFFVGIRAAMRRSMDLSTEAAERGRVRTAEALDFVSKNAGPDGYLVGNRFSVADLAAASLLSITCYPDEFPWVLPQPRSPLMKTWIGRWQEHAGVEWVRETYTRHRGASAQVSG